MNHLSEEEVLDGYYGNLPEAGRQHLSNCPDCRDALANLADLLNGVRDVPVPTRGEAYGREVWARLEPKLSASWATWWRKPWILAPAAAALLMCAFIAGMITMRSFSPHEPAKTVVAQAGGISEADRRRVLAAAINDHLDRSEILLAQLLHATPGELNASDERSRARDLVDENRLLRTTAERSGDEAHAALLDDLERVLLDLANGPAQLSSRDVEELRRRVENQGLLFKVRVSTADSRTKGRT